MSLDSGDKQWIWLHGGSKGRLVLGHSPVRFPDNTSVGFGRISNSQSMLVESLATLRRKGKLEFVLHKRARKPDLEHRNKTQEEMFLNSC